METLLYKEEHQSCLNYRVTQAANIRLLHLNKDTRQIVDTSQPILIFVLKGEVLVTTDNYNQVLHTAGHFSLMKDGAICCNAGHFDVEVDVKGLSEMAKEISPARKNITGYLLENGRRIYILAEGRLVNLAAGDGHPAEIMDMSFAIQALSARYLVCNGHKIERKIWHMLNNVPRSIDQEVARRILASWGCEIDTLTPAQRKYLYGE